MTNEEIPEGSLGYQEAGNWVHAKPGSRWFSTVTMLATHHRKNGEWVPLYEDEDDADEVQGV